MKRIVMLILTTAVMFVVFALGLVPGKEALVKQGVSLTTATAAAAAPMTCQQAYQACDAQHSAEHHSCMALGGTNTECFCRATRIFNSCMVAHGCPSWQVSEAMLIEFGCPSQPIIP